MKVLEQWRRLSLYERGCLARRSAGHWLDVPRWGVTEANMAGMTMAVVPDTLSLASPLVMTHFGHRVWDVVAQPIPQYCYSPSLASRIPRCFRQSSRPTRQTPR